jgi:hypothetical protein
MSGVPIFNNQKTGKTMAVRAKSSNFAVHKKYNCFYG